LGKVVLDLTKWNLIEEREAEKIPYSIKWDEKFYKPMEEVKIQFDPTIIIRFIENKEAYDNLKKLIILNDKENILTKLEEFDENISILKERKKQLKDALKENKEV
jgi:predicted glycosyltransferase